jgi:hypothetical protein
MFDEEESKSPLNPQQWYEATNAKNALHQKTMEDNYYKPKADPRHWYTDSEVSDMDTHVLLVNFMKKIDSLITRIGYHPSTPTTCLHVTQLRKLMICVQEGQQPRKATLKILNKWWRLYEPKL